MCVICVCSLYSVYVFIYLCCMCCMLCMYYGCTVLGATCYMSAVDRVYCDCVCGKYVLYLLCLCVIGICLYTCVLCVGSYVGAMGSVSCFGCAISM